MIPETQTWPQVYRPAQWVRILVPAVFSTIAIGLLVLGFTVENHGSQVAFRLLALCLVPVVAFVWAGMRTRLTLWADRLEFRGMFRKIAATKSDLKGYRAYSTRNGRFLSFYFKSGRRTFHVRDYRDKPGFAAWMADIPDLNALDEAAYRKGLLDNAAFGSSESERRAKLKIHRIFTTALVIAGGAIGVWLLMFPSLAAFWAATGYPPAIFALAVLSRGRYALMWDKAVPRLKLSAAWIVPLAVLGGSAFAAHGTIDGGNAVLPAAICAAGLVLIAGSVDGRWNPTWLAITFGVCTFGIWGGMIHYDRLYDTGKTESFVTRVTGKSTYRRKSQRYYHLQVAPWGPPGMPREFHTDARGYETPIPGSPCASPCTAARSAIAGMTMPPALQLTINLVFSMTYTRAK